MLVEALGFPVHLLVLFVLQFSSSRAQFNSAFFLFYKSNGFSLPSDSSAFLIILSFVSLNLCVRPTSFLGLPLGWTWVNSVCHTASTYSSLGIFLGLTLHR